jgi:hypothetical protein
MPKTKTKMKVLKVTRPLPHISPGISAWKEVWVQQTPGFISSLVIKLAKDKTSSLLRHESSEQLPPLDYTCDQNYSQRLATSDAPSCRTWLKLRLWCINWWRQTLRYLYRTFLIIQILFRQMYTVLCYSAQLFIIDCATCFEPIQGSSSGAYLLKLHQLYIWY